MNFGAYTMEEHEEHESCGPKGPRAPEFAAKFLDKRGLLSLLLHRLLPRAIRHSFRHRPIVTIGSDYPTINET